MYNRKWEKFTKPIQAVGHLMVKEFYANTWEPDKAKRKNPTYTSSVRGIEVSFAPSNIKRVLKLKSDPYPNAPSYHERKANKDYRLDHILEDMCEEDAQWVCHRDGRPHYLRRSDLEPMSKGWYEFICHSILPTINRSELTVERAMLIHSIIIDENINVEEIIAEAKGKSKTTTPPQQPPQQHPQQPPQFQQQQDFSSFYTHFDTSMSQLQRRLDQQHEENRRSFEAINTRMDRMDNQLSFLCYSNQLANEQMLSPYQNTARQFKEMEMQGIPMTMANLTIHRQREEANKGKAREIVPDSEDTFVSSESEEF
ncbi:hypothetical protein PIB30_071530 [Stylosanthes scabra]|uniref:Putative plant transposon protein domain-containing protein n=1 Tax=Stylosanthes scabra TaxID=79078 RepID=A0ABU6SPD1_9FABA|nr:hypothetical protein [Stylosanthes scabra]